MPVSQKQKSSRGIPRKASNPTRKAKFARYKAKATCFACKAVFRSPKKKAAHVAANHSMAFAHTLIAYVSPLEELGKAVKKAMARG